MESGDAPSPTVGLALIARNEEQTLPRLLDSCETAFDQIVLLDTGSTDGTVARFQEWAASQAGTRCDVGHFEWIDDFAAARQAAFGLLETDWWCWADCDDVLSGATSLRELARSAGPSVLGFNARYDYAPTEFARHIRLARAGAVRWHGEIHEVLMVISRTGRLDDAPDRIVRWSHKPIPRDSAKPRMRRDLEILERDAGVGAAPLAHGARAAAVGRAPGPRPVPQRPPLLDRRAGCSGP
jgi:glycosyltransferase involved in cell wall biosynthesis